MEGNEAGSAKGSGRRWTFNTFMIVVGFVTLVFALLVAFGFSPAAFVVAGPFLIPSIVLTGLHLRRPRSWTYLAAGIANAYLFVLYLPFIVAGFANPAIWTGFISSFLAIPVLTWNLSAGVLGFLHVRKGLPELGVADGLRSPQGLFVIAVAALCLGAGIASGIAYNRAASNPQGGGFDFAPEAWVNLTTENTAFSPAQITVRVNTITQISVTNKDTMLHTFTYTSNGTTYSHDLLPSATTSFLVLFHWTGPIQFWCVPHRDLGMVGTITVSPPAGSNKPVVTFGSPDLTTSPGNATIIVSGASQAVAPTNYKANLQIGTSAGTAVAMPPTGGSYVSIIVGSTVYRIYWIDVDGGNTISAGDQFRISGNGVALPSGSSFTFYLLWSDGSAIQTSTWNT